jgi:hypothetical protein
MLSNILLALDADALARVRIVSIHPLNLHVVSALTFAGLAALDLLLKSDDDFEKISLYTRCSALAPRLAPRSPLP